MLLYDIVGLILPQKLLYEKKKPIIKGFPVIDVFQCEAGAHIENRPLVFANRQELYEIDINYNKTLGENDDDITD